MADLGTAILSARVISEGKFGIVYRDDSGACGSVKPLAIKQLPADEQRSDAAFVLEVSILHRCDHPHGAQAGLDPSTSG